MPLALSVVALVTATAALVTTLVNSHESSTDEPATPPTTTVQNDLALHISSMALVVKDEGDYDEGDLVSGVVVAPNLVITTFEAIRETSDQDGPARVRIGTDLDRDEAEDRPVEVVAVDSALNLAILRLTDGDASPIALAEGSSELGDTVWLMGYPGFNPNSLNVTRGVVSGVVPADDTTPELMKTDATSAFGSQGGAVLDVEHRLIGVVTGWMADEESGASLAHYATVDQISRLIRDAQGAAAIPAGDPRLLLDGDG